MSQTRDYTRALDASRWRASGNHLRICSASYDHADSSTDYNSSMRHSASVVALCLVVSAAFAQNSPKPATEPKSVTVPITLDHNRVVIDVYLPLPDGSTKRVRGWVDNGNPDLEMSRRAATLMGLNVTCNEAECSAPPPAAINIGEMKIGLSAIKKATIPLKPPSAATVMKPGMSAEINIPSSVLRNYDVLIDFPNREFTIGAAGSLKFKGVSAKVVVNAENGRVEVPAQIENKKYNLELGVGSPISFLNNGLFATLASAYPDWPHMTGAVGPANVWGAHDEPDWKLMRIDRLQFGRLHFTSVPFVELSAETMATEKQSAVASNGLLGSEALLNYRVGIDYTHSTVYFDLGSTFKFPDFDVIGLVLRPEDDTRFTVIGVAEFEGKPSVADVQPGDHLVAVDEIPVPDSTMGQVWSLLEGSPGQERKLTLEREGKQFTVSAKVQHFLAEK